LRRAVSIVVLFSLIVSALSLSASAQSQNTFYLHDQYVLDGNAPTQTVPKSIGLSGPLQYFNWTTTAFSSDQSYPAGNWNVTLWMNVTTADTQYRVRLGVHNQSGDFELSHAYTPLINTPSPTEYEITMALSAFTIGSGGSLVLGLLRQLQNGTASHTAFVFFDSVSTASGLNGPVATTTTTTTTTMTTTQQTSTTTSQQATTTTTSSTTTTTSQPVPPPSGMGSAFAVIGIGAGVSVAGAGAAFALSGQRGSEVIVYGGFYYCRKHRVPLGYVQGRLWCPVERRYLRP
jgi:hypothetical protein